VADFCEHSDELLGSMKTVNFFTSSVTILFSRKTLHHDNNDRNDDTEVIIPNIVHTENKVLHSHICFGT
jgi:hypothetical protein